MEKGLGLLMFFAHLLRQRQGKVANIKSYIVLLYSGKMMLHSRFWLNYNGILYVLHLEFFPGEL